MINFPVNTTILIRNHMSMYLPDQINRGGPAKNNGMQAKTAPTDYNCTIMVKKRF